MHTNNRASALSMEPQGARAQSIGGDAAAIIPFERDSRPTAEEMRQADRFKAGVIVGLTVSMAMLCAVMWLWAIPTVEHAEATALQAYEQAASDAQR